MSEFQVPSEYYCPISYELMEDPVMDEDGVSAERKNYERLINERSKSLHGKPITIAQLRPNIALRKIIDEIRPKLKSDQFKLHIQPSPMVVNKNKDVFLTIVIDTSYSMDMEAAAKNIDGTIEKNGFTLLDLVVHSVKTFISNLHENDYITIIKYSTKASFIFEDEKVLQMNNTNKVKAFNALDKLEPDGQTNIWDGIYQALEITRLNKINNYHHSIMLFTDGVANITPSRGHEGALNQYFKENGDINVPIHTFGFGYSLDSVDLNKISSLCNGTFSFIPDPTMVGDVFSNAIGNMLNKKKNDFSTDIQFQEMKSEFINLIGQLFHEMDKNITGSYDTSISMLSSYISKYSVPEYINNSNIQALLEDARGEVMQSLKINNFSRWGKHYLLSLASAHKHEVCNNFKDPGVQIYATDDFERIRDEAETIYGTIPCNQSIKRTHSSSRVGVPQQSMTLSPAYSNHTVSGCFHGLCLIQTADDVETRIKDVKIGTSVKTGNGQIDTIEAILVTKMKDNCCSLVCLEDGWMGTPTHPIKINNKWVHPKSIDTPKQMECDAVYSILLKNRNTSVFINGIESITLAHDLHGEIEEHDFFGSEVIVEEMKKMDTWKTTKRIEIFGDQFKRSSETGHIIGF